jgi:hypothetical protein
VGGVLPAVPGLHIGVPAPSRAHVDAFWIAGTAAGYRSDGEPGPRPQYTPDYYGAFLLDPDGNSIDAVHRSGMRTDGVVDHVWIRVSDLTASRPFYVDVAERAGLRIMTDDPDRLQLVGRTGSMSLVPGTPTEHVALAFAARNRSDVAVLRDPDGNAMELGTTD